MRRIINGSSAGALVKRLCLCRTVGTETESGLPFSEDWCWEQFFIFRKLVLKHCALTGRFVLGVAFH